MVKDEGVGRVDRAGRRKSVWVGGGDGRSLVMTAQHILFAWHILYESGCGETVPHRLSHRSIHKSSHRIPSKSSHRSTHRNTHNRTNK